ncbi:hypothetical protein B0H10DRAFT_1955612 [Mycena sp. CBHHK59/15]|nr:hypothetical protein B0H10DRAFT_1955612 [Mycena sp. CBHHK59/15]
MWVRGGAVAVPIEGEIDAEEVTTLIHWQHLSKATGIMHHAVGYNYDCAEGRTVFANGARMHAVWKNKNNHFGNHLARKRNWRPFQECGRDQNIGLYFRLLLFLNVTSRRAGGRGTGSVLPVGSVESELGWHGQFGVEVARSRRDGERNKGPEA